MSRVQFITVKKSPVIFFGILFATLVIVFVAKLALDFYTTPVVVSKVTSVQVEQIKSPCKIPQHEVFSAAEFESIGITPAEAQGVDLRWETAKLVRSESEEFIHGMGSAGDDC